MRNRRLDKALKTSDRKKEKKVELLSGQLGIPLNGQKLVEVPNRQGFVFVRLKNNTSELIQAYNATVAPIYDLPVLVTRSVGVYKVIGRNVDRYTNQWTNAPLLPKHGAQHSFNPDLNIGGDITWIYSQQFMPLLGYPSGSDGSPRLAIAPYIIRGLDGAWKYAGNTGTPNMSVYNPTTGSRARMVLVYIDTVSGNPYLLVNSGTYVNENITGSAAIASYIPQTTSATQLPIVAVRLLSGTSSLSWNNLYDVRPFLQVLPTGTGGAGALNIQDEGVPLGTATTLNVVGVNADISISGTVARLFITGSTGGSVNPPVTGSIVIQDNGQTLGSALILNAGNGISANISGTIALLEADAALLRTEDLTPYVNGTGTTFPLTFAPNSNVARLYYNGVRQRFSYNYTISGSYIETLFTPVTGSVLIVDYNESSSTGTSTLLQVQDEGILQGSVSALNFVGAGVVASVSGGIGTISISGSAATAVGWNLNINEAGSSFSNWSGTSGNWRTDGTQITQTGTAASYATAYYSASQQQVAPAYVLQADLKMISTGAAATHMIGLVIGYTGGNTSNGAGVELRNTGGTKDVRLVRAFTTTLLTISYTINDDQYYTVKIVSSGGYISVYVDGTLVGTAGNSPGGAADARFIGLLSNGCQAHFKNIKGYSLSLP